MIEKPDKLIDPPNSGFSIVDLLSDVLAAMRLSGAVFLDAEFTAPWCVKSQLGPEDCKPFFAQPTHLIGYHFVTEGHLICEVEGMPRVEAGPGDILLLTRNDPHVLGSEIMADAVSGRDLVTPPEGGLAQMATLRHGGGGERTAMFCGFLGTESPMTSVLSGLPSLLKITTPAGARREWMISSMHYAAEEARAGSAAAVARLVDLLFAEAVKQHADNLPSGEGGWFAALRDPAISRALALIHERYAENWTADRIKRMFGTGEQDIQLPVPIWVHLTYQNAFVDDAGQLQIRRDVYNLDSRTLAAIKSERGMVEPMQERKREEVASTGNGQRRLAAPQAPRVLWARNCAARPPRRLPALSALHRDSACS